MTVLDLTAPLHGRPRLREAESRGPRCGDAATTVVGAGVVAVYLLTSKDVPGEVLADAAPWLLEEE